jgi:hypothetical protein
MDIHLFILQKFEPINMQTCNFILLFPVLIPNSVGVLKEQWNKQ